MTDVLRFLTLGLLPLLLLVLGSSPAAAAAGGKPGGGCEEPEVIPGKYIVTLRDGISAADVESHLEWVGHAHRSRKRHDRYGHGIERELGGLGRSFKMGGFFNGYSGEFADDTIESIRSHPDVADVEPDHVWHISRATTRTARTTTGAANRPATAENRRMRKSRGASKSKRDLRTQAHAGWNLATVSHRAPNATNYLYDSDAAGQGTWAYVVDTGVFIHHTEFLGGRAVQGYNAVPDSDNDDDEQGHGTHCAGLLAGTTFGVAKRATVVSVKVFGAGSSATSTVIDGFNWAVEDIRRQGRLGRAVVNLSVSAPYSAAFGRAVKAAYDQGVLTVAAAGNEGVDASQSSPGAEASALTVGSVDSRWQRSYFSNVGELVDVFAPGSEVESAWIGGNSASYVDSGTSMAAPHVSGVALCLMSAKQGSVGAGYGAGDASGPEALTRRIVDLSTRGRVGDAGEGSPNRVVYNGGGSCR